MCLVLVNTKLDKTCILTRKYKHSLSAIVMYVWNEHLFQANLGCIYLFRYESFWVNLQDFTINVATYLLELSKHIGLQKNIQ